MPERDAFEEWMQKPGERFHINLPGGDLLLRHAFEAGARSRDAEVEALKRDRDSWRRSAIVYHDEQWPKTEAQIAWLKEHPEAQKALYDCAQITDEHNHLREALRDLSHHLNRHRCGNWEPELKAADERARTLVGEEG